MRQGVPNLVAAHARVCASPPKRCGAPACPRPGRARNAATAQCYRAVPQVSGSSPALTGQHGRARLLPAPLPQGCGPALVKQWSRGATHSGLEPRSTP